MENYELNEMETYEDNTVYEGEIVETGKENSDLGALAFMAIGAAGAAAIGAAVKLGKKLWAKHKAKKELKLIPEDAPVEVTDEDIADVIDAESEPDEK